MTSSETSKFAVTRWMSSSSSSTSISRKSFCAPVEVQLGRRRGLPDQLGVFGLAQFRLERGRDVVQFGVGV